MFLSVDWLRDYVPLPLDLDTTDLAHELTLHAVEVEGVDRLDTNLQHCVFGRVLSSTARGSSGWLISVDDGTASPPEITGSTPLDPDSVTVVQRAPGQPATLMSPANCGLEMVASDTGRRGWLIPGFAPVAGDAVASTLGWDDDVIEIDNKSLTNRPDLWCHEGIARELAAIYDLALAPPLAPGEAPRSASGSNLIDFVDGSFCNRLTVMRIARGKTPQPDTPLYIRSRLAKVGQRPINFYTDLTNYVMFATGQPSHAYDARLVSLPFSARRSTGVSIDVLTGSPVDIPSGTPMIVDASSELAVAGVVGGRRSSVTDKTQDLLVEMASFDARSVRDSSLSLGLRTDASSRFEKALDTQAIDRGRALFLNLVRQHDPGADVTALEDVTVSPTRPLSVRVSLQYLNSRMGTQLTPHEVTELLSPLGLAVQSDSDQLLVNIPTWRSTGDIGIAADILEEVGRRIGYDELPPGNPSIELRRPTPNALLEGERRMREFLAFRAGAQEILTYPWVTDRLLGLCGFETNAQVRIIGAPSEDRSSLRPSLIPNLVGAIEVNLAHRSEFRLFEVGTVYLSDTASKSSTGQPLLSQRLAAAFVGPGLVSVFRHAVGAVLGVGRAARSHLELVDPTPHGWGDAVAARDIVDRDGRMLGHLAAINLTDVGGDARGLTAVCFELETSALTFGPSRDNVYTAVSAFPTTSFDLSMLLAEDTAWSAVRSVIDAAGVDYLQSIEFLDDFRSDSLDAGTKSLTFRVTLVSPDRTLTAQDRDVARDACTSALVVGLGGRPR